VRNFRQQLFREHLGEAYNECFNTKQMSETVQKIHKVAEESWDRFNQKKNMRCHLMKYPVYWDVHSRSLKAATMIGNNELQVWTDGTFCKVGNQQETQSITPSY